MTLLALYHSESPAKCNEFSFVLSAVGLESEVVDYDNRFYLVIEEQHAAEAYQHLKAYVAENTEKEVIDEPLRPLSTGFAGAYLYGLILLMIGALKSTNAFNLYWQSNGLAHSVKIMQGEWWRTITALGLHADAAHLAGNIGFGALFGILVSQYIGSGAAWFTILIAGALGNGLNAYLYQTIHLSIGASTMVFAALGILGVFALSDRHAYTQRGMRRWVPFFATFALLGFIGAGGERTDIMAHLSGYLCGCLSGVAWMYVLSRDDVTIPAQSTFAALTIGLVGLAWSLAL
ncbi:MAG: rhomboid family intramembrane serine protease [Arenicella sp.]|nr:rhomboid family intramembrane serine protease [Arenicella sp.]